METTPSTTSVAELAEQVSQLVQDHPSVVKLHGGEFGEIATYLPGRRITGVRISDDGRTEISVVLRLDRPLSTVVSELRSTIAARTGGPVDITVADVAEHEEPTSSA